MALTLTRRFDRIEVVYPNPTLHVRYIDEVRDEQGNVVAVKGYHRAVYATAEDIATAPLQVQAAAQAMAAFQKANPDADATVKTLDPRSPRQ